LFVNSEGRGRNERLDDGGVSECFMTGSSIPDRWTISNVVLTLALIIGLILCYFLAIPFLPAIVWSVTLGILFVPLDARIRRSVRSANASAAATVAIVALIVVVPGILVIGSLLNEAARSVTVISPMLDAERWSQLLDNHPRLAPALRWVNERLDLPELIKASISWVAGWSGSIVRASVAGAVSLLLTFYFLFYILRDREKAVALAKETLPLSPSEFSRISDRFTDTIFATVVGIAAVSALQGALGGGMFWWLGLPAPVFWGVLMGLVAVVPFLGAFIIWMPAALFLALSGDLASAAILTFWGTIVVGLVDNVVYPILVGRKLMMHTIPSFIAIVSGVILLGAPGVVLGPLLVSISLTLMEVWKERAFEPIEQLSTTRKKQI
jgi:predicted PurR-regulated permease PerM